MKSATIAAALLASVAVAQPHGHNRHHHAKRELVTEWETVWETATVIIDDDSTQTIPPSPQETSSGTPVEFFEPAPSSSSSSVEAPKPQPETPTTTVSIAQSTYQAPPPPPPSSASTPSYQAPPPPPSPTLSLPLPPPSSTYAPAPPASSGGSGGSTGSDGIPYGKKFDGQITYYNAALGACGYPDEGKDDTENIVAIPKQFWDNISTATSFGINQPAHPLCDKTITITASNGKTTTAKIRDRCDGCVNLAIDVTPHAFLDLFGSLDGGRLDCSWSINE